MTSRCVCGYSSFFETVNEVRTYDVVRYRPIVTLGSSSVDLGCGSVPCGTAGGTGDQPVLTVWAKRDVVTSRGANSVCCQACGRARQVKKFIGGMPMEAWARGDQLFVLASDPVSVGCLEVHFIAGDGSTMTSSPQLMPLVEMPEPHDPQDTVSVLPRGSITATTVWMVRLPDHAVPVSYTVRIEDRCLRIIQAEFGIEVIAEGSVTVDSEIRWFRR